MLLQYLLGDVEDKKIEGDESVSINKIEYDSKKIEKGDLFVAIKGYKEDGTGYIDEAIKKGAVAIILEDDEDVTKKEKVTYVYVKNARIALSIISAKYYNYPARMLDLIGITGTKGKTTTAYMIRDILLASSKKVGMIGTICITYGDKIFKSERTCPESLDLNRIFRDMVDSGIEIVVMEVSSHALALDRVYGLKFAIGVFTNLSEEHLDFHKTMDEYLETKAKLFKQSTFAVINGDDIYASRLSSMIPCKIAKFGLDNEVNITATDVRVNSAYTDFKMYVNKMLETVRVNIPGRFTVYNALASISVCSMLNCQMDAILLALANVRVPGRSEVVDIKKTFTAIVDYAHNPSSLEAILSSTKKYATNRVICVFGCGGNRDKEKRTAMGKIAGKYANFTIITTDNPRDEKPQEIMKEIEKGIKETKGLYTKIENRTEAIKFAMRIAWKNDIIIVAGKGHETYQELKGGKRIHFDDREVIKKLAAEMKEKNLEEEPVMFNLNDKNSNVAKK